MHDVYEFSGDGDTDVTFFVTHSLSNAEFL